MATCGWAAGQGLLRIGSHGVEHLEAGRALPTGRIVSLREDAEGSIWVGANGGLFRLRETLFSSYSQRDGLSGDYARALLEDRDGSLWVATTAGLDRLLPDGRIVPVPVATPSGRRLSVLSLALDRRGDLWVGTYADGVFVLRNGRVLRHFGETDGIPNGHIRAIVIDDADTVWLATQRGVVHLVDGRRAPLAITGLPDGVVTALASIDGALWIGSVDGAAVVRDGVLQQLPLERLGGAVRAACSDSSALAKMSGFPPIVGCTGHVVARWHAWGWSRACRWTPCSSWSPIAWAMPGSAATAACCELNSTHSMQWPRGAAGSASNATAKSMAWATRRPMAALARA